MSTLIGRAVVVRRDGTNGEVVAVGFQPEMPAPIATAGVSFNTGRGVLGGFCLLVLRADGELETMTVDEVRLEP